MDRSFDGVEIPNVPKNHLRYFLVFAVSFLVFTAACVGPALKENMRLPASNTIESSQKVIAEFLSQYVHVLDVPVYVYNWSDAKYRDPSWQDRFASDDARGYEALLASSQIFYKNQGKNDGGDNFGKGLYLALDPVSTQNYGGDSWLLMQLRLGKGFRFLNLVKDNAVHASDSVIQALKEIECPGNWNQGSFLTSIFAAKVGVSEKCIGAINWILDTELKLDGFLYPYASSKFSECPQPDPGAPFATHSDRNGAFIVISSKSFDPSSVQIFNTKSVDDFANRLRIETLFYKVARNRVSDPGYIALTDSYYLAFLQNYASPEHPGLVYKTMIMKDPGNLQTYRAVFCPREETQNFFAPSCVQIDLPRPPVPDYPTKISESMPPIASSNMNTAESAHLLWPDLEGKMTDNATESWIKLNLFGCAANFQYSGAQ